MAAKCVAAQSILGADQFHKPFSDPDGYAEHVLAALRLVAEIDALRADVRRDAFSLPRLRLGKMSGLMTTPETIAAPLLAAYDAANLPEDVAAIFSVYRMLLDDGNLSTEIEAKIRAGNWAAGAIRATISEYAGLFDAMTDPYFQARGEDVRDIGRKLHARLRGDATRTAESGENLILAGEQVSITDIARHRPDRLAGILCTAGSALSHTAVLANALGLPAVMGTGKIKDLSENALAVIDSLRERFHVVGLAAHSNAELLGQLIEKFHPRYAALVDEEKAEELRRTCPAETEILAGDSGVLSVAAHPDADIVLSAIVGAAGLRPVLAAIEQG